MSERVSRREFLAGAAAAAGAVIQDTVASSRVYDPARASDASAWSEADARSPAVSSREPLACAVEAFQRAIAGKAPDNADTGEALAVQRVIDAARKAARDGTWTEVE